MNKLPQFQGLGIVRADSLSHYNGLLGHLNRIGTVNIIINSSYSYNDKSKRLA